jgi:hypothetical protein
MVVGCGDGWAQPEHIQAQKAQCAQCAQPFRHTQAHNPIAVCLLCLMWGDAAYWATFSFRAGRRGPGDLICSVLDASFRWGAPRTSAGHCWGMRKSRRLWGRLPRAPA